MALKWPEPLQEPRTRFPPVFRIWGVPGSGSFPQLQPAVLGADDDRRGVGLAGEKLRQIRIDPNFQLKVQQAPIDCGLLGYYGGMSLNCVWGFYAKSAVVVKLSIF